MAENDTPPPTITAMKIPIIRKGEYDIWSMNNTDEIPLKFHNVPVLNPLGLQIKSRFGGNEESKKMQKNVLKHQFENFATASNDVWDKAYDRNKPGIDEIDIDDLYSNLRVYEDEMKKSLMGLLGVQYCWSKTSKVPSTLMLSGIDGDDFEELDLRWQVAMLTIKVKKFIQRIGKGNQGEKDLMVTMEEQVHNNESSFTGLVMVKYGLGVL
ncbi:hypothetical protein Tco_0661521 [Tanacetum coccineum]